MIDINKAKQKNLDLAIRGKLTKQLKSDGNAADLIFEIQKEKEKQNIEVSKTRPYTVGASYASPNADNDSEIPFEIPENWVWCKLDQISKVISKGTTPRGGKIAYKNSGIRFLRAENILGFNKIDTHNLKYIDETIHNSVLKRSILLENDILISIAGTLGRTGLVTKDLLPLNSNQAISFIRLINDKKITPNYVLYVLNLNSVKYILMNKKVDMAIPNISLETISNCPIPIPPRAEQKRIVEKVDKLFEILDKIDEAQKKYQKDKEILKSKIIEAGIRGKLTKQLKSDGKASDLLDEIRKEKEKLIKEGKIKRDKKETYIYKNSKDNLYYEKYQDGTEKCIQDELPFEIPDNWEWCKLGELINVISGVSYKKEDVCTKGYRVLRGGNIQDNCIYIQDDDIFLPNNYYDNQKIVQDNDVVIVASTGSKVAIGKPGVLLHYNEEIMIGAFLRICRPICNKFSDYIKIIFKSDYYRNYIREVVAGTSINNIKESYLTNFVIPFPPIAEQERIVKCIEGILMNFDILSN